MRPVRLNVFQRTQRAWDQLHPYNAVQLMGLRTSPSAAQVAHAFARALADLRLGAFSVTGCAYQVDTSEPPPALMEDDDLVGLLSREMNRPFPPDRSMPLRPFVSLDNGGVVVGVVYQHWVADSVSIRMVMRQWLLSLVGRGGAAPVRFEGGTLLRRFGAGAAGWSVVAHAAELLNFGRQTREMRRLPHRPASPDVRVTTRRGPPGLIDGLAARCRSGGFTVGDAFLAAAALACDRHGPAVATSRRRNLAMGTIVDLRSQSPSMPANAFGLYLGFMISTFREAELSDYASALLAARRLRRMQFGRGSAAASQMRMGIGLLAVHRLRGDALRDFYRKRFPLAGGLSNVNLNRDSLASCAPDVLRSYWRVSPTGPLLPLVLTPTTLGDDLTLCCTWQPALLDSETAGALLDTFFALLTAFADGRVGPESGPRPPA
jgi:hypothetical protein